MNRSMRRGGFTLVEIMIVVVVLAILAAAIVPQFADATKDAKANTAIFNLHTLRSQIGFYKAQHGGRNPASLSKLTVKTNIDETTTGTPVYGPYLTVIPDNPLVEGANTNVVGAPAAVPPSAVISNSGWMYDSTTGQVWINDASYLSK